MGVTLTHGLQTNISIQLINVIHSFRRITSSFRHVFLCPHSSAAPPSPLSLPLRACFYAIIMNSLTIGLSRWIQKIKWALSFTRWSVRWGISNRGWLHSLIIRIGSRNYVCKRWTRVHSEGCILRGESALTDESRPIWMASLKSWSEKARAFGAAEGEVIKYHLRGGEGGSIFDSFWVGSREGVKDSNGLWLSFSPCISRVWISSFFFFLEVFGRESEGI